MSNTEVTRTRPSEQVPAIAPPRLPYHPMLEERFGIDKASWKALVEAIFPNATSVESVILALSYCRARKLDPFKRNVHIVPIWNRDLKRLVDTVWPGIGELRTTAFRTGEYAGRSEAKLGPDLTQKVGSAEITFPEWAQVTVYRMVRGQKVEFCGPRVYWLETYATMKRDDDTPNEMWRDRPRGQLEKCAEAAALRAAFPEEVGCDQIADEVGHVSPAINVTSRAPKTLTDLTERVNGTVAEQASEEPEDFGMTREEINAELPAREPGDDLDPLDEEIRSLSALSAVGDVKARQHEIIGSLSLNPDEQATWNAACEKRLAEIRAARSGGQGKLLETAPHA